MADIELVVKLDEKDYINIKNAINSLIENGVERASMSKICLAILDGTPLKQGQKWIPVSERLPEDYEEVIASVDHEYVYSNARHSKEYGWEWAAEYSYDYWTELKGVDAWMSLPKAYNPESEEATNDKEAD